MGNIYMYAEFKIVRVQKKQKIKGSVHCTTNQPMVLKHNPRLLKMRFQLLGSNSLKNLV